MRCIKMHVLSSVQQLFYKQEFLVYYRSIVAFEWIFYFLSYYEKETLSKEFNYKRKGFNKLKKKTVNDYIYTFTQADLYTLYNPCLNLNTDNLTVRQNINFFQCVFVNLLRYEMLIDLYMFFVMSRFIWFFVILTVVFTVIKCFEWTLSFNP